MSFWDIFNFRRFRCCRRAAPTQTATVTESPSPELQAYAASVRADYEAVLKRMVEIPSVSVEPERKPDIERTAQAAVELLRSIGATAEAIKTAGNPVVYGEILTDPSHQTVLIYNHLDVQPADPSEWNTHPFTMTIEDGAYRGRGTTDDKGPAMVALFAAKYAAEHKLPINIKFVWELEEEIGGPSFDAFIEANKERLKTDSIVIADTIWISRDHPAIPYGLRGLQGMLLRLNTAAKDVHSGTTGGVARNPITELAEVISKCVNARTGSILIPGFYDDVVPPSPEEIENFVRSGFSIENFKAAHELKHARTADSRDAVRRIMALPTFEVHGIKGGYQGEGIKTVVPHFAEAKISMRLVPDQNPDRAAELLTNFVREINPDVEVVKLDGLRPYLGEFTGPYYQAASKAMARAFGKQAAYTREGGSIGAALSMNETLHAPIVFLGLSLPEHGYHAINENFDWQQASGGIQMFIHYFSLLSQLSK
jgi:acetylornithine deacetylase/succinyl-diaminopimelate desuccinylase-like protein